MSNIYLKYKNIVNSEFRNLINFKDIKDEGEIMLFSWCLWLVIDCDIIESFNYVKEYKMSYKICKR